MNLTEANIGYLSMTVFPNEADGWKTGAKSILQSPIQTQGLSSAPLHTEFTEVLLGRAVFSVRDSPRNGT